MKTLSFSNQCTSKEDELSLCRALLSVLGNFSCRRTLNISPAANQHAAGQRRGGWMPGKVDHQVNSLLTGSEKEDGGERAQRNNYIL